MLEAGPATAGARVGTTACGILHSLAAAPQRVAGTRMPSDSASIAATAGRFWLALIAASAIFLPSHAYTVRDLYTAAVPRERGAAGNDAGFAAAMEVVLVKVTGLEDAAARMRGALPNARVYVQRYGIDAEGRLEVGFDPSAIDRLITDAGLPIWGRERPATLVLARLEPTEGPAEWLAADSAAPAREMIDAAADLRGVPLVWPLMTVREQSVVRAFDARAPDPAALAELAARYRANAVLLATLSANAAGEVSGAWTLGFGEETASRSGGPLQGIALAAEQFAGAYATSAIDVTTVDISVAGITNLEAYARTLDYLEKLSVTEAVAVEEISGETLRLRLALRGDPATFARSVALDDQLVPLDTLQPGRLAYRFQP